MEKANAIIEHVRSIGCKTDLFIVDKHTVRLVKIRGKIAKYCTICYEESTDDYTIIREKLNFSSFEKVVVNMKEKLRLDNLKDFIF